MRFLFNLIALTVLFAGAVPARQAPITIILVRHAEPATLPPRDPGLASSGAQRAQLLARMLVDVPLTAVYSTQFARTRETAEPTATSHGLDVTVLTATSAESHVRDVVERVRNLSPGSVVLVVGHSNTVPAVVEALGGGETPQLTENEFDSLFIVTLSVGKATAFRLRYGEAHP